MTWTVRWRPIGLRSTRIRTLEGHLVTMPNKTVADSNIINITQRPTIRQLFTVNLTYSTKPEKMREALLTDKGKRLLEDGLTRLGAHLVSVLLRQK